MGLAKRSLMAMLTLAGILAFDPGAGAQIRQALNPAGGSCMSSADAGPPAPGPDPHDVPLATAAGKRALL